MARIKVPSPDLAGPDEEYLDETFQKVFADNAGQVQQEQMVAAAYKTVDTFAGLIGRKLWLKNSVEGAYTDGWEIGVPFKNPHAYQMMEHEISHVLFQSDFKAKESFSDLYSAQIIQAVEAQGKKIDPSQTLRLKECLGMLLNILDDHRVNSLWATLYPGSYKILHNFSCSLLSKKPTIAKAHENLLTYVLLVSYDVPNVPAGRLDRFRPAIVAALKRVEGRGPAAPLMLCKWLVTQLVTELIRSLQGAPPPPDAGSASIKVNLPSTGSGDSAGQQPSNDTSDASEDDSSDAQGGSPQGASGDGNSSSAAGTWEPPTVTATPQDRVAALKSFIELTQTKLPVTQGESRVQKMLEDVRQNRFDNKGANTTSASMVQAALGANVNDSVQMDLNLARSGRAMDRVLETLEEHLRVARKRDENDWITRDAHAKVVFKDVDANTAHTPKPLGSEDRQAAARLKDYFSRVHMKRAKRLADSGNEVDVEAFVARVANGNTSGPIFKEETSGRGFKTLILLDRSSSMQGLPSVQVERAARILRRAMKQPNIEVNVWGFQSALSEVRITRIAPNIDVQDSVEMPVRGETPLHVALRVAVNWLGSGDEKKQIIILTDGHPVFSGANGKSVSDEVLMRSVRKECNRARRQGISVTAVGIGKAVKPDALALMFGERKYWTQVLQPELLDKHLVSVVSTSFVNFLQNG